MSLFRHATIFLLPCCLLGWLSLIGQENATVTITGTVVSQADGALDYCAVILTPTANVEEAVYAQTADGGQFILQATPGQQLLVEVFYLGYGDHKELIGPLVQDTTLTITLIPSATDLAEVVVRDTLPPIVFKEDTVTYNARHFFTGRERKLNELIDKLPGLAVGENNRVTYKGQEVSQILVEDQPFFGGNSELALTGLPADAVGRVEVLEDYNALGFDLMPGGDREIALNILLREDKRNVYFGELTAGAGTPEAYTARADVFNYSKSKNIYLIGGSNNVNTPLLSDEQSMQLLSSSMSLMEQEYGRRYGELVDFQPPLYATENSGHLTAFGIDFSPRPTLTLNMYGIVSRQNYRFRTLDSTVYALPGGPILTETEDRSGRSQQTLGIVRVDAKATLKKQQFLTANLRMRATEANRRGQQRYRASTGTLRNSQRHFGSRNIALEGVLEYVRRLKGGHSHQAGATVSTGGTRRDITLLSDVPFLVELLGTSRADSLSLRQQIDLPRTEWTFRDRFVYRINSSYSLTADLRGGMTATDIGLQRPTESQQVRRRDYTYGHQSGRITLAAAPGQWQLVPGVELYRLNWRYDEDNRAQAVSLLPSFQLKRTFINVGILEFDYRRSLSDLDQLLFYPGPYVTDFVNYRLGNPTLRPYPSSRLSLSFRRNNSTTFSSWSVSLFHTFAERDPIVSVLTVVGNERRYDYAQPPGARSRSTTATVQLQQEYDNSDLRIRLLAIAAAGTTASPIGLVATHRRAAIARTTYRYFIGERSDLRLRTSINGTQFDFGGAHNTVYNLSLTLGGKLAAGNWLFTPEMEGQLSRFTEDPISLLRASGSVVYRSPTSPWSYRLEGQVPLSGRSVLNVSQQELFYRQLEQFVFPAWVTLGVGYDF